MKETKRMVKFTSAFKRDYKAAMRRGLKMERLDAVIEMLALGEVLPLQYKDHELTNNWKGHRECHIQPDWLLIYRIDRDVLVLTLTRTGTHSDLFGK